MCNIKVWDNILTVDLGIIDFPVVFQQLSEMVSHKSMITYWFRYYWFDNIFQVNKSFTFLWTKLAIGFYDTSEY